MKNKIISAFIQSYRDNGQVIAGVVWSDGSSTQGAPSNVHMRSLLARAVSEGIVLQKRAF